MDAKWTLYFVLAATMSIVMGNSGKPCIQGGVCSLMAKCDPGTCTAHINMTVLNSTNITFVLSDNSSGYIAVGFSVDNQTTGNSTVYGCTNDSGVVKFIHATLNDSTLTEVNSSAGEIQGTVNTSWMTCKFTVNDLSVTNALQNGSYIFFVSGNFSNGTLGPVTRFPTSSLREVIISSPGATGNNTNATATSTATASSTTSTKRSTTTSTKLSSSKTTVLTSKLTSKNLTNPGNPSSMGNNALQPNTTKATFILLGAVMVALFSG